MSAAIRRASARAAMRKPIGDPRKLDRRLDHQNPKYAHVRSELAGRTGSHAKNLRARIDRRGELFARISRNSLAKLFQQREDTEESIYALSPTSAAANVTRNAGSRSSERKFDDTVSVVSSVDASATTASVLFSIIASSEFLLVDAREPDQFDKYHIDGAISLPVANIRRDKYAQEMFSFKNVPGCIIIVYAEDETSRQGRIGNEVAALLCEKGWNNVYLLTGGIIKFAAKYPRHVAGVQALNLVKNIAQHSPKASATAQRKWQAQERKQQQKEEATKAPISPRVRLRQQQGLNDLNFDDFDDHEHQGLASRGGAAAAASSRNGGQRRVSDDVVSTSTTSSRASYINPRTAKNRTGARAARHAGAWR